MSERSGYREYVSGSRGAGPSCYGNKKAALKRPLDKIIISGLNNFLVFECVLFNGDLKVLLGAAESARLAVLLLQY